MAVRKVKWTVLAVGEGDAEVAWLNHLKDAYFSRACGSTIKIQQAYGKGAANVIKQAITYAADRGYSRCMAVFDTDKDYSEEVAALARKNRLISIPSEPCLEGFLLRLHGDTKVRTSEQHKRRFEQRFGARVQETGVLRSHFGVAFIESIRDAEPLVHLLINTFGIPRRLWRGAQAGLT
ncbi:hypothetical protein CDL60_05085 [Roseateles noduli]|nr:hypothetical protein CDL60_05085 [Roseateles noduli]